jgi:hypothetical protein
MMETEASCENLAGVVEWLRLALSDGPNWVGLFCPIHLRTETDPVSETSYFLFSRIMDDGKVQKPSNSADHAYLTYLMLQRQLSHLNGRKLDHHQV